MPALKNIHTVHKLYKMSVSILNTRKVSEKCISRNCEGQPQTEMQNKEFNLYSCRLKDALLLILSVLTLPKTKVPLWQAGFLHAFLLHINLLGTDLHCMGRKSMNFLGAVSSLLMQQLDRLWLLCRAKRFSTSFPTSFIRVFNRD